MPTLFPRSPSARRGRPLGWILAAWTLACADCSSSTPAVPAPPPSGLLRISGSGTVFPFAVALAQAYHAHNPIPTFRITSDGTARGIKYAAEGTITGLPAPLMSRAFSIPDGNTGPTLNGEFIDVGIASRDLLPDEREAYPVAVSTPVAIDGLAVATHPSVTVSNLTVAQVRDLYAGNITNWRTVGGPDLPVYLVVRDPISGTAGAWGTLVMQGTALSTDVHSVAGATGVVPEVSAHPGAVGYLSIGLLDATVHPVNIEGVAPTLATLAAQQYPIRRPFVFVTAPAPSALAADFVRFARSPAGQQVIVMSGAVPPATPDGGSP